MNKLNWNLLEYRNEGDPLRQVIARELLPNNDLREHEHSTECDCMPDVEITEGVVFLIHASFDGREALEAGARRGQ